MRKKALRLIGFKEYDPEVVFASKCHEWSIKSCKTPGSDVEFLKLLFEYAGFEYDLIHREVQTSEEIIDAVENGTADMSLIALIVSPERLQKVAFTIPTNYLQFGYVVKELNVLESDQFLIKTFEANVYWVLTLVIALVAAFAYVSYRNYTYKQWLWIFFSSFFNQANHPTSRKTSFLFLTGAYWFTAYLTISFYQARMKYFLTVPLQKGVDFYTMAQLMDQLEFGKWSLYEADVGYTLRDYCRDEQCNRLERLAKMGKIIYHANLTEFDHDSINLNVPFSVTLNAFNTDLVPNQVSVYDKTEKLLFISDTAITVEMVAFVLNKNLTVELEQINRAISRFSSSYGNILNRYRSPFPRYEINSPQNGAITLTLLHFDILFYLYIFMVGCSLLIFGVEFLHYRFNWRNWNQSWMPQSGIYEMQGGSLSTDSTLRGVNFTRKTIKFFVEERIAEIQKVNGINLN